MTKKITKKAVKKPAAKKAAPKAAAKKPVATMAPKAAPIAAPVAAVCACDAKCCGRHKGSWLKKLFILVVVFALGFVACAFCPKVQKMHRGKMFRFDESGCLMLERIKCPMLVQRILAADLDNDGCITKEELRTWKNAVRSERMHAAAEESAE